MHQNEETKWTDDLVGHETILPQKMVMIHAFEVFLAQARTNTNPQPFN